MLGFEPRISCVRSYRCANCVTTTKPINCLLMLCINSSQVCTFSVVSSHSTAVEHTPIILAVSNLAGCEAFLNSFSSLFHFHTFLSPSVIQKVPKGGASILDRKAEAYLSNTEKLKQGFIGQIRLFLSKEWVEIILYGSSCSETKGTFAAMRHLRNS